MSNDTVPEKDLFPPAPRVIAEALAAAVASGATDSDAYSMMLETQCGVTDDSQPVEQYDGTLGVTRAFVDRHQPMVGQLQWNDDLASKYTVPGNVSGVRWCTGALISDNLFLTAGHCFDQTGGNWQRPRINGSSTIIPSTEIATNMHINFNYQVDPAGTLREEVRFPVIQLLEYRLGGLDFAIAVLGGSPGRQFGVGEVAQQDANKTDMLAIIGHPAGVPKRIEAGALTDIVGNSLLYDDIDTLGGNSGSPIWHANTGKIVGVHTNGGCTSSDGANSGVRIARIREESPTIRSLPAPAPAPLEGLYQIRQRSSNRYVDAHEHAGEDFRLVTRPAQNNDSQRWTLTPIGSVCTIRQVSSGRFVDAHEHTVQDFRLVTRSAQNNDTQRWVLREVPGRPSTYTIQQLSNGRYVDAHEHAGEDFRLVTRAAQNNDTQRWEVAPLAGDPKQYTVRQAINGRFVDAHENAGQDFRLVTRTAQHNDTQRWEIVRIGDLYSVQQVSSGRLVDAHEHTAEDFRLVTRTAQHNDTQRWVMVYRGSDIYSIQQLSNGRYVDAHEDAGQDFRLVTRAAQHNDTQRWIVRA